MSQTVTRPIVTKKTDVEFDVELRKVFKVFNGETAVWGGGSEDPSRGIFLDSRAIRLWQNHNPAPHGWI